MENNYNYRINQKEPSSEEIRKHMDFDALLGQVQAQEDESRFRIHRWVYAVGVAAAVLLLVLFIPSFIDSTNLDSKSYFAQQDYINPPLVHIEIQKEVQNIPDAHQGGVIEYASGSRLVIPAAAFMNDRSKLIGGEVEIHYRELHDFVDFFVSGVPMAYDSVGLQRYLTSSGMVEVYAEQNGKRLSLAPGKAIQVELVSEIKVNNYFTIPQYQVYKLDTVNRNWQYQNVDMVQFVEEDQWSEDGQMTHQQLWQQKILKLNESYQEALADLQIQYPLPDAPYKPTQATGNRPTLELDFQNGDLALDSQSQLQQEDIDRLHNGTIWEISPESSHVDARAFNVVWERVRLKKLDNHRYLLTLVHSQNEESLIVSPVLLGQDYQQAIDDYQLDLQAYNQAVTQREHEITDSRDNLQQVFSDRKNSLERAFETELSASNQKPTRKVINRFIVNEFGIWACGTAVDAQPPMEGITVLDENGQPFEAITAYVVNEEHNTLYRYMATEGMSINLQENAQNLLWVVDKEGNLSLSKLEQISEEDAQFQLSPVFNNPIESEEELRRVLRF